MVKIKNDLDSAYWIFFEPPAKRVYHSSQHPPKKSENESLMIWGADKFHSATEIINTASNNNYLSVFEFLGTNTVCNWEKKFKKTKSKNGFFQKHFGFSKTKRIETGFFSKQNGSRPDFFQNKTDRDRIFFRKQRIETGSFSEYNGSRPDLFQKTTDRDRIFFKNHRIRKKDLSELTGFGSDFWHRIKKRIFRKVRFFKKSPVRFPPWFPPSPSDFSE